MVNIRQISSIDKEGSTYTLVSIKVVIEDAINHRTLTIVKEVGTDFLNPTALFAAVQTETVAVVSSSLLS